MKEQDVIDQLEILVQQRGDSSVHLAERLQREFQLPFYDSDVSRQPLIIVSISARRPVPW